MSDRIKRGLSVKRVSRTLSVASGNQYDIDLSDEISGSIKYVAPGYCYRDAGITDWDYKWLFYGQTVSIRPSMTSNAYVIILYIFYE